jgi:nitrogen fixation-related uncharacterized protein
MASDGSSAGLWDNSLLVVGLLGLLFFGTTIYAFVWARRERQFKKFDEGARSIFDEEEPEGTVTDSFPGEAPPHSSPGKNPGSGDSKPL